MKISYKWIKEYIKDLPAPEKVSEEIILHAFEVEDIEKVGDDSIFDLKVLPDRAHDCLSHQGIAREVAGILGLEFKLPEYKILESKPTNLKIEVESDKCRRYMGRIVRNMKVGPSPDWVKIHLESIGQRSINNIVDATNIVMYDCGQPCHAFDLDKTTGKIIVRYAQDGETITTLDNKEVILKPTNLVIADEKNVLAIAGVKGGKAAEVDANTKNIVLEVANFDPASTRKTGKMVNIFTDAVKRFENDLSPELCEFAMKELSALIAEYGEVEFEDVVDVYPVKQEQKKLSFSAERMSKIIGIDISVEQIKEILNRYHYEYKNDGINFEIVVPVMRLDLNIEEDMADEIGRILGYDMVTPKIPKINFTPKLNDVFSKIIFTRNKLLTEGYSEVMTYSFTNKGEVGVLQSASDKKFLRTNLSDGLKESIKLNQLNVPLLGMKEIKVFEIGTVFKKGGEEIRVAFGDKKNITETTLDSFSNEKISPEEHGYFSAEKFLVLAPSRSQVSSEETSHLKMFKMWSSYPFISRDIAVWVPEDITAENIAEIIRENMGSLVIRGPELFDEFKKEGKISYAFRSVFQSKEKTLSDDEINAIIARVTKSIEQKGWQVR